MKSSIVAAALAIASCTLSVLLLADARAQTATMQNPTTRPERTLIVIGASYAKDWGTPALPGFTTVINKGVGGQETSDVRKRFVADVVAARPETVLIWGHINDIHRAPADGMAQVKERVRRNYSEMVAEARNAGIDVMLATEITLGIADTWKEKALALLAQVRGKQDYRRMVNAHVKELNEWLRDFARREQLVLLDFERAVDSGNGSRKVEYSTEDGSHVSPAGYAALTAYSSRVLTSAAGPTASGRQPATSPAD